MLLLYGRMNKKEKRKWERCRENNENPNGKYPKVQTIQFKLIHKRERNTCNAQHSIHWERIQIRL